eukprot:TRINITY_DN24963_c0_g2_i1.p2 TRINITY_DN24963_c0_g2~~TRINITY_DN24963_c0_g2_i1.p2  ORF type:complete len:592 (+),score=117.41 TRINITY_DN24963_c0_g2_i1:2536-4311(+)
MAGEVLCRICGPFNGKETHVEAATTQGVKYLPVRNPRNPCTLNWYMPTRVGYGVLEVRVNWKSHLDTYVQVPRRGDRCAQSRPKQFIVAVGGDYQSSSGRRSIVLRGASALPSKDGGRSALLWLFAAGVPRESKIVALAAPLHNGGSGDFEVRAVRLWGQTLWLLREDPLSSGDLRAANAFRQALLAMQRRKPHRLCGTWDGADGNATFHIECIDVASEKERDDAEDMQQACALADDVLHIMDSAGKLVLAMSAPPGVRSWTEIGNMVVSVEEESEGVLVWMDGSRWTQRANSFREAPTLDSLGEQTIQNFATAAHELLKITNGEISAADRRSRWPARLVPLRPKGCHARGRPKQRRGRGPEPVGNPLEPFDLEAVEAMISAFGAKLEGNDEDTAAENGNILDEGSDAENGDDDVVPVDVTREAMNEEFMWRIAETEDWDPKDSRNLVFVESSIALPRTSVCVECEEEGKPFSKSQLARHPDERRCKDCVAKGTPGASRLAAAVSASASTSLVTSEASARAIAPPGVATRSGTVASTQVVCSACGVQLSKENCSASQRSKVASGRRCNTCVSGGSTVETFTSESQPMTKGT